MADLFLYNGFTPRRRSPGDLFLDNGMAILRAYLKKENIDFMIEDRNTVDGYDEFKVPETSQRLRELFDKMIFNEEKAPWYKMLYYKKKTLALYSKMVDFQNVQMDKYLHTLTERIARDRTPVLGIKLWFGNTFISCVKFCEMVRRASPETIIVVGGPHANVYYSDGIILKYSPFDLAVYSEGEAALANIVKIAKRYKTRRERLERIANADIPNLVYRAPDGAIKINPTVPIPINEKLIPEYTDEELSKKIRCHTIIDGLGCDYGRCSFCIHPFIYPKFRIRDPKLIVDEIGYMLRKGVGFFTFTASDTPLPHARRIAEEILRRKLRIEYTMLTRASKGAATRKADLVETYRIIIRSGMRILYMGAESGNDDVLKEVLNKNLTAQEIVDTVECIRKASELEKQHVYIITSYIYPIPLTKELLDKGVTLKRVFDDNVRLGKLTMPDSFQVMPATLYPGPAWYSNPSKYNISYDPDTYGPIMLKFEWSINALGERRWESAYTMLGKKITDLVPLYMKLSRAINKLGIPSDLNDEHLLIARCAGYEKKEDLEMISKDLFLDILSCYDEKTLKLFDMVNSKSEELAKSNALI